MDRLRTIANQRELDPSFSVPCRRCAGLLQEWNRFCPFCLEDQFAPVDTDVATTMRPKRADSAPGQSNGNTGLDFIDTLHPFAAEVVDLSDAAVKASIARTNARTDAEMSLAHTSDYWQTEVLGLGSKRHWAARWASGERVLGLALTLALLAVVFFGLKHGYFETLRPFRVDTERVQTALNRGDLSSAVQLLDALESQHPDDAGVRSLREALDLRIQERSVRGGESSDVGLRIASSTAASDETVAPSVPAPGRQSPVAAALQDTAPPRTTQTKDCNETLAALSLCTKEQDR